MGPSCSHTPPTAYDDVVCSVRACALARVRAYIHTHTPTHTHTRTLALLSPSPLPPSFHPTPFICCLPRLAASGPAPSWTRARHSSFWSLSCPKHRHGYAGVVSPPPRDSSRATSLPSGGVIVGNWLRDKGPPMAPPKVVDFGRPPFGLTPHAGLANSSASLCECRTGPA